MPEIKPARVFTKSRLIKELSWTCQLPQTKIKELMENLLAGNSPYAYCFSGGHVQEKLSCYFRFLRDTLGGGTWPASTAWEDALRDASAAE